MLELLSSSFGFGSGFTDSDVVFLSFSAVFVGVGRVVVESVLSMILSLVEGVGLAVFRVRS